MKIIRRLLLLIVVAIGAVVLYFSLRDAFPAKDEAMLAGKTTADFPQATADYFKDMDGGIALTEDEIKGRNTWMLWTGGNEAFWDWLANNSFGSFDLLKAIGSYPCGPGAKSGAHGGYGDRPGYGEAGAGSAGTYADTDYYRHFSRDTRFEYLGLMNEPGFVQATEPDDYGLCLDKRVGDPEPYDEAVYGRPTGILGLRLYPNPNFDSEAKAHWDAEKYYSDPKYFSDPKLVRPYRVGMSCAFCHVSHHPLNPPEDPNSPELANLSGTIGAQYFWFGRIFGVNLGKDNIIWHILDSQKPGAVDTSLVPTDYLNNPRAMNAIFDVPARLRAAELWHQETITGGALDLPEVEARGDHFGVPHILWDGADSVGVDAALTRVYINIGEYHQEWIRHIRPLIGVKPQSPIEVATAQENSVYWNATQERAENLAKYLIRVSGPMHLKDNPEGAAQMTQDAEVLKRGKIAFADNCARCHSSKLPDDAPKLACGDEDYLECWNAYWDWTETDEFKEKMREIVLADDFLKDNYLSTDARIPVTLLETEICSSMASNAIEGHVWDNFSSQTYKDLPAVGEVTLHDPIRDVDFQWETKGGGRGYQRVPSLISIWATAPYLHNNEVGLFNSDPSISGRLVAFDDGIRKMLWPETREGIVNRTTEVTYLKAATETLPWYTQPLVSDNFLSAALRGVLGLGGLVEDGNVQVGPIPAGTPVSLISNLNVDLGDEGVGLWRMLHFLKRAKSAYKEIEREGLDADQTAERLKALAPEMIELSTCPDFIVDRGHNFGADLPDEDKEALIELIKTL